MQCASVRRTWRVTSTNLATSSPTSSRSPVRSEVDSNHAHYMILRFTTLQKRTSSTTQTIVPESSKVCLLRTRATNAQRVATDGHTEVQMRTRIHVAARVLARTMCRLADAALQGCRFSRLDPRHHARRSANDTNAGHEARGRGRCGCRHAKRHASHRQPAAEL